MSSNSVIAGAVFVFFMLVTVAVGLWSARGRRKSDLAGWSVGGRNLGSVLLWVLLAGEIFTTLSYYGAAGWGYRYGVPIFYLPIYLSLAYTIGYLVGPRLREYATTYGLVSVSEIASYRLRSKALGVVVTLAATLFLVPGLQHHITGMGVVVSQMTYGALDLNTAYVVSFVIAAGFVVVGGLLGSAWVSVLKDVLVLVTLVVIAVYVPLHYFGGLGNLFDRLVASYPQWLTLPGNDSPGYGPGWLASTTVVNSIGLLSFPTILAGYLGARNARAIRVSAISLSGYQMLIFVPILIGMAGLMIVPNLANEDLVIFQVALASFPPWFIGVIAAAGALTSIVPVSVYMVVIGTMWGRSVVGLFTGSDLTQKRVSQLISFLVGVLALVFALTNPTSIARLSLVSLAGMVQVTPVVVVCLFWRRMTATGAICGVLVGLAIVITLVVGGNDPLFGINAGLVGLVANLIVNVVVSRATAGTPLEPVTDGRPARESQPDPA